MEPEATVHFSLPASAENVPLIRHALSGMAESLGMEPADVADLKTIVTEACMNVVVHAYEEEGKGLLEVEAEHAGDSLVVTVRDYGQGIRPLADVERRSLRLGLPLIAALTESLEISAGALRQGTQVVMRIPISPNGKGPGGPPPAATDETRISAPAGEMLGSVLSRVISMFAARANFSVDRLSDAVLLSDAISAHGPDRFPDGKAQIEISEQEGSFELRVGPLDEGGGQRLIDGMRIPELDATLEGLADEIAVEKRDDGERLLIRIAQPGG